MKAPSFSVDGHNLALSVLESTTHDLDGVTFTDGNRADEVLGSKVLAQSAAQDLSSDA